MLMTSGWRVKTICLLVLILSLMVVGNVSAAKSVEIISAQGNQGVDLFITINGSIQVNGGTLNVTWNPAVMNVTAATNLSVLAGWLPGTLPAENGFLKLHWADGINYVNGNQSLAKLTCNAKGADGSFTIVTVNTTDATYEINNDTGTVTGEYSIIPGSFTVNSALPIITVTGITDSDGDGYNESAETLTISYTSPSTDLQQVWIGSASSASQTGTLSYTPATGNLIGNIDARISARDSAGNVNTSAPFHIYNNYVAYITDPSLGTIAGLNMAKTSVYDIFNGTAKAITISGAPDAIVFPTLGEFNKTIVEGSTVVADNRKNTPIAQGALPQDIKVYSTPSGILDFTVNIPGVNQSTILLIRGNSSTINTILANGPIPSNNVTNWVDKGLVGFYKDHYLELASIGADGSFAAGWAGGSGVPITFYDNDLPRVIRECYIDPSAGYSTQSQGLSLNIGLNQNLSAGEYMIAAVCMENDRFGIIAQTPFVITEQPKSTLAANSTTYAIGVPVKVTSTLSGDNISAVVVRSDPLYPGNLSIDFTTFGPASLKHLDLYANGNMSVMEKLVSRINITSGYGKYAKLSNTNSVQVPTDDLLPGPYYVYMFLENHGNMTAFNQTSVTIGAPPPQPAAVTVNVFNATGQAFNADSISFYNGSWSATVVSAANTATYPGLVNGTTYQLMVNRTGFLNVSGTVSAFTGQNRSVNVNLTQLGELYTPKMVMSENGTILTNLVSVYNAPTGAVGGNSTAGTRERLMFNLTVNGNDTVTVAVEFPVRVTINPFTASLDGANLLYQYVNGTFTVDASSNIHTTNATMVVVVPAQSDGKLMSIRFNGTLKGDSTNDGKILPGDALFSTQCYLRLRDVLPTYDYADVAPPFGKFTPADALFITQNYLSLRDY